MPSKSDLGLRLLHFIHSTGLRVKWTQCCDDANKEFLHISLNTESVYDEWKSYVHTSTVSGKKRSLRDLVDYVIKWTPSEIRFHTSRFFSELEPVLSASSAEELNIKLTILGF